MSSDEDDKKELYQFDPSYLKNLNKIRRQFNLMAISDEEDTQESQDAACISLPSSTRIDFNDEMYECNPDYLKNLNSIRRELNMKELSADESEENVDSENYEMQSIFERRSSIDVRQQSKKKVKSNRNEGEVQNIYTPPKKKMCMRDDPPPYESLKFQESGTELRFENVIEDRHEFRAAGRSIGSGSEENVDSPDFSLSRKKSKCLQNNTTDYKETSFSSPNEPSEQSSPVKEKSADLKTTIFRNHTPDNHQPFFSLNVPTNNFEGKCPLLPKVTVLMGNEMSFNPEKLGDDEETPLNRQVVKAPIKSDILMECLELPKKFKDVVNFPSLVQITKFGTVLNREIKYDHIFDKMHSKGVKKNLLQPVEFDDISKDKSFETVENEAKKGKVLIEVETRTSLKNMNRWKNKATDRVVLVSSPSKEMLHVNSEETMSDSDEDIKKSGCRCLSFCFTTKPKNYFS